VIDVPFLKKRTFLCPDILFAIEAYEKKKEKKNLPDNFFLEKI